jgi:hypothetical protein
MKLLLTGLALIVLGGVLAATWSGYGAYVMVVLDLIGLVLIAVALGRRVMRGGRKHTVV